MNSDRENMMKKLDWTRLLGFDQVANDRTVLRESRLGSKIGAKPGVKLGVKLGVKVGAKNIGA